MAIPSNWPGALEARVRDAYIGGRVLIVTGCAPLRARGETALAREPSA